MDNAYPGTTPWERLGAGGGGQVSPSAIANEERKQQSKLQRNELVNRSLIASQQARAQVISAALPFGSSAVQEATSYLTGYRRPTNWDTPIVQGREMMPFNKQNLDAQSKQHISQANLNQSNRRLTDQESHWFVPTRQSEIQRNWGSAMGSMTGGVSSGINSLTGLSAGKQISGALNKVKEMIYNMGKRPNRFK